MLDRLKKYLKTKVVVKCTIPEGFGAGQQSQLFPMFCYIIRLLSDVRSPFFCVVDCIDARTKGIDVPDLKDAR